MSNNWTINRIGLVNFWLYDEEEFYFSNGRLLLRGSNGSGKSVTMQSFIPLLLDGNKSADRLDPFGSRARKLENYLLGEENNQKEDNTGYLYMEFIKPESGNFITIGMGLRARRNKPLDFWGFAITDGRKIGVDFLLYKDMGEKIPLSKNELKFRLGAGGELHDSQKEYMAMVNKYLFGFETIEDYDQMIKLLIQLRTPKLSKDFKPTVIYEIMNNSLQPLSDEDLRPMSEAIENMDNIKIQLEHLLESKKAADGLKREYDKYNRFMLLQKSKSLLEHSGSVETVLKEQKTLKKDAEHFQNECNRLNSKIDALRMDKESVTHQWEQMSKHESVDALTQLIQLEGEIKKFNEDKSKKDATLNDKTKKQREIEANKKTAENNIATTEATLDKRLLEMSEVVEDLHFDEHAFFLHEIKENFSEGYNFGVFRQEVDKYRARLENGCMALEDAKNKTIAHEKIEQDLDRAKTDKESAEIENNKALAFVDTAKEDLIEKAYIWESGNTYLKIEAPAMHTIQRHINGYGDTSNYDDILTEVRQAHNKVETDFGSQINEIKLKKGYFDEQKNQAEKELSQWQKKKDPQPQREEKTVKNRERLEELQIPFIPLYMALDFKNNVDDGLKGILEEALLDMGLLDALVIPAQYKDKMPTEDCEAGDRYIFAHNVSFGYNLSEFLTPVTHKISGITHNDIQNVIEGILINKDGQGTSINEKGSYSIGIINGQTSKKYIPKFLGIQARIRYRQENIERLQALIAEISIDIDAEIAKIKVLENSKSILTDEYRAFPNNSDIETAVSILRQTSLSLENKITEVHKFAELEKTAYKELRISKEAVLEATAKIELALRLDVYQQALKGMNDYRDMLSDVQVLANALANFMREELSLVEQLEEITLDIDDIRADIRDLERSIEGSKRKIVSFEEILNRPDSREIAEKLKAYKLRLDSIPEEILALGKDEATNTEKYKSTMQNLLNIEDKLARVRQIYEYSRTVFEEEYNLAYIFTEHSQNLEALARAVLNELKQDEKSKKGLDEYAVDLQGKFKDSQQYMTEYNMSLEYLFEDELQGFEGLIRKRLQINARINGKASSFYSLVEFLSLAIEENEGLLKESDRQIFEEILADTVGKKIRGKISGSQEWVKNMNRLMESMNTSSGLSFSLAWKSKTAEVEGQLDTRVLVDILRSDSQLLSEEQMSSLSTHFRSKIQSAIKSNDESGVAQFSYHTIMKEALDYRKWFEFQLSYVKTSELKKELTDNAFFRFSGGEKAMAMYVPLFASVYARYQGARNDCPRIISLDEAFAGVDETNIRDMFRLIEDLKLSYIINSQVLMGDYDTVPSLSICELLRPNNADYVSVIRYKWDGKVKTLVV